MRVVVLSTLLLAGIATAANRDEEVYRWVDEDGVVHYGDHVPPEYSKIQRDILNEHAVKVGELERQKTDEEIAEEQRRIAEEEARKEEERRRLRRDQILLDTYLSVQEIEMLRDRRLELIDARSRVTQQYLENLKRRLTKLQQENEQYQGPGEGAAVPEELAQDLVTVLHSINEYEDFLEESRLIKEKVRTEFDRDIQRFQELKGAEQARVQ